MNETNRTAITLVAALLIVLMAVVIFVTWAAPQDAADRVQDFGDFIFDHRNNDASRLILTLAALVVVVLALLVIIVELAPEEEARELKVEQAGATTIVPAEALRTRVEEALVTLPQVTAARARVFTRDNRIAASLDLTVTPDANVASVTQEAARVMVDTLQADLGLPVAELPTVRIAFGGPKPAPVASSLAQPPQEPPAPPPPVAETVAAEAPAEPPPEPPAEPEAAPEPPPEAAPQPEAGEETPGERLP